MIVDPTKGFAAKISNRRSRNEGMIRSAGAHARQTVGHNLLTGLVEYWPACSRAVAGASLPTMGIHAGNNMEGTTNALLQGNGPTLAQQFLNATLAPSCPDTAQLKIKSGTGLTLAIWAYFSSITAGVGSIMLCKDTATSPNREFSLFWTQTPLVRFEVNVAGNFASHSFARATWTPTLNTWYFVVGRFNPATSYIHIGVNAGAIINFTGTFVATAPSTTTAPMYLGNDGRAGATAAFEGRLQRAGYWQRSLSDDEVAYLYNGGSGRDYPFN